MGRGDKGEREGEGEILEDGGYVYGEREEKSARDVQAE